MTVAQLQAVLERYPPETLILVAHGNDFDSYDDSNVEEFWVKKMKRPMDGDYQPLPAAHRNGLRVLVIY